MAKYKPVGSRKAKAPNAKRGLIPCAILIVVGFSVIFYLFYEILKSGR
ncbi:MAG TPA: hypothetical protein VKR43_15550 [Bryobacteraceae bacterium]|jgi:hypothetical protein|nr:hypothetical protein [Bryobacteraceae bacterium]